MYGVLLAPGFNGSKYVMGRFPFVVGKYYPLTSSLTVGSAIG